MGGFESPARFLPPLAIQRTRRASLPAPAELSARLHQALAGLPVSAARLQPFLIDVERSRTAPPLTSADLQGTSLAAAAQGLLVKSGGGRAAPPPLSAVAAPGLPPRARRRVRAALAPARGRPAPRAAPHG